MVEERLGVLTGNGKEPYMAVFASFFRFLVSPLVLHRRHNSVNFLRVMLPAIAPFGRILHGSSTVQFARDLPGGRKVGLSDFASTWHVWGHRHGV